MNSRLRIIVTGLIAQHPTLGGVTWDYLQYMLGLHRLGHDVFYFEDSGEWPYNLDGGSTGNDWVARDPSANINHLASIMSRFDMEGRWAYHFPIDDRWFGLTDSKRKEVLQTADLLINVSGTLMDLSEYKLIPRRAYIDSDPVFTQLKLTLGNLEFRDRVNAHNVHFTFGETLFPHYVPDTGHFWRPTRSPIVIDEWSSSQPVRDVFTTVMNWTSYKPLQYEGRVYGQKDIEFRKFLQLPKLVGGDARFEIAMPSLHHLDWETEHAASSSATESNQPLSPVARLAQHGWSVVKPADHCGTLDDYRKYVQSSMAEWSVAKNGYVQGQSGWFSCRSSCYLAAGRPIVVQDTGFSKVIPTGRGILTFKTLDEAVQAVRAVSGNLKQHSAAARECAAEYFDARVILPQLIEEAMRAVARPATSEMTI
ncbi:MAG TPA: hypothetical protein VFZ59_28150 [Verrucomicrobiae bacterium]|nr:hypothetical protein [Verrucomicrobiae bacterium]